MTQHKIERFKAMRTSLDEFVARVRWHVRSSVAVFARSDDAPVDAMTREERFASWTKKRKTLAYSNVGTPDYMGTQQEARV